MDADKLAKFLARRVFEIGSDPNRDATRIEFKSRVNGKEIAMGGFSEGPLADFLAREIKRHSATQETGTARRCRCGQVEWEDGARRISCGDGSDHYVDLDCVSAANRGESL